MIAEEVAEIDPDLVVRDQKGELYTVRYDAVNAMLLNEFLKEHRKVEEQAREMQEQKSTVSQLKTTVVEQHVALVHLDLLAPRNRAVHQTNIASLRIEGLRGHRVRTHSRSAGRMRYIGGSA